MTSVDRKIIGMGSIVFVYLTVPLLGLMFVTEEQGVWFSNIFFDKMYIYQLVPMFIIGLAKLDESINIFALVRYKNRMEGLAVELLQKYIYTFIYLTVWFTLVIIFSLIKFDKIMGIKTFQMIDWYIRYLLGLMIITNISIIFSKSSNKILSSSSYICVYIVLVLEVMGVVPEINANFPHNVYFIFSWIFCKNGMSCGVMLLIWIVSMCFLFKVSVRKDIF